MGFTYKEREEQEFALNNIVQSKAEGISKFLKMFPKGKIREATAEVFIREICVNLPNNVCVELLRGIADLWEKVAIRISTEDCNFLSSILKEEARDSIKENLSEKDV